jgi:integrase
VLLTLLYGGGLRISEACALRWRDLTERDGGAAQVVIYGTSNGTRDRQGRRRHAEPEACATCSARGARRASYRPSRLAERIMSETDAMRMVALVDAPRDRALLTLLYGGGLRISEACALRWRDLTADMMRSARVFLIGGAFTALPILKRT